MAQKKFDPYVPDESRMAELTIKAVLLGAFMAIGLGAANAYVGMKAGLTVAATFPAAVVAMAVLRPLRGTILEENIARTTASVGEALVAGAIFTIPAFVLSGAWESLRYGESMVIMLIGGVLGVLFVILLRRTLVVEADLPFPESVAASEIVKAGQKGQSGASYVFGAMGLAGLWELFKNAEGIQFVEETTSGVIRWGKSTIQILEERIDYGGGMMFAAPSASPMLMGVGYIVGPKVSAILFCGAVVGWLFLVPLALFLNPALLAAMGPEDSLIDLSMSVWSKQIRPLAVGTMIVAAFYTLYNLRGSLVSGIGKAISEFSLAKEDGDAAHRTDIDLDFKKILMFVGVMTIATAGLYYYFSQSVVGALVLTVVMVTVGFLFAAVAGYLVGLIGSSNNPISGLTLSALLISALLWVGMVAMNFANAGAGVAAVLGVAGIVCCAAGIAGDMMQDLKVGHILGGTPWRMEIAEIIGVIAAALVLPLALMLMHNAYVIGSANLPAPQAGLMALMAQGIVGGEMAWPLVIVGMFFALGLILIGAPAPMLVAVGMYLPFYSTAAIFAGGIIRWLFDSRLQKSQATPPEKQRAENVGILISSGFIAGESLMAVTLALLYMLRQFAPWAEQFYQVLTGWLTPHFLTGLIIYPVVIYLLVWLPIDKMRGAGMSAAQQE